MRKKGLVSRFIPLTSRSVIFFRQSTWKTDSRGNRIWISPSYIPSLFFNPFRFYNIPVFRLRSFHVRPREMHDCKSLQLQLSRIPGLPFSIPITCVTSWQYLCYIDSCEPVDDRPDSRDRPEGELRLFIAIFSPRRN